MELNRVLYKATILLALPLSRAYLLLVLGFSKGIYTTEGMVLLNGAIANSFNQRNDSCIFVDIETNVDTSNTLMTTSDAVNLVSHPRQIASLDQILHVSRPIREESTDQSQISGTRVCTLGFGKGTPKSVSYRYICLT